MATKVTNGYFTLVVLLVLFLQSLAMANIRITSYNSTGLNEQRVDFIKDLLNNEKIDILFLQETWLYNSTLSRLNSIHDNYLSCGVSGMPDSDEINKGRPYGGVGILWHKSLAGSVKPLKTSSNRVCAVTLKTTSGAHILLVNSYMPGDTYSVHRVDPEFQDILEQIQLLWLESEANHIIFGGDMNVDMRRGNAHSNTLIDYVDDGGLTMVWSLENVKLCDTFVSFDGRSSSCIDHFIVSNTLAHNISDCTAHECVTNGSNHLPVTIDIDLRSSRIAKPLAPHEPAQASVAWHRVEQRHVDMYKTRLKNAMRTTDIPMHALTCQHTHCDITEHIDALDKYCDTISNACVEVGKECLPKVSNKKLRKPMWIEEAKPLKVDALFWDSIWKQCGKPQTGALYDVRQNTKRKYHYAVRRLKSREANLRKQRLAEALSNGKNRNFWTEVRKTLPCGKGTPAIIDNAESEKEICEIFAKKYEALYNSVPPNELLLENITSDIKSQITKCQSKDSVISVYEVAKAIKLLKNNKHDGEQTFWSNHLLYGPPELTVHVSMLLSAAMIHGHMPNSLLTNTIIPLVKDSRGDICNSDNYRGISLSSCLCKVLELVIMDKYGELLHTSDLQFAFKKHHSTTMCTLMLKETVNYYMSRNTDVYCCLIDASKAFDRVKHDKLFELLMKRGIPATVTRLLLDMHRRQHVRIKWNGSYSQFFGIENGVKQGGVISPILFTLYIDVLLNRLKSEGIGCHIGQEYYGSFGYADDLTLLCPSLKGLQQMLDICSEFGHEFDMKYNPTKSECIRFGRRNLDTDYNMILNGQRLKWVKEVKHLGNYIMYNLDETLEVSRKSRSFIYSINMVLANFRKTKSSTLNALVETYCSTFYGAQAWNLADRAISKIYTTWNKAIRRVWNLPYRTHTSLLSGIIGKAHIKDQILLRFFKMFLVMMSSTNKTVKALVNIVRHDARSVICHNLEILACKLAVGRNELSSMDVDKVKNSMMQKMDPRVYTIKELIECIEGGESYIANFSVMELQDILEYVATN